MEKVIIDNSDLHFEHKQWDSELAFWKDELKSFNLRLDELVNRWTKKEVLQKLEHYQNEFMLHNGVIEKLQEEIQVHETNIAAQERTGRPALDTILVKNHSDFRKKMEEQRQIYADLKKEFFRFLSQYM
ncbi:hypothetical protein J4E06_15410 [Muricauda sp. NFXS6]|uniref:hypothetical protein n=1 Tax=Flavobacteriaceae TaxID=49546 RepID=UPI002C8B6E53|nr:hypothetical protein [Allomuricauda sp.]